VPFGHGPFPVHVRYAGTEQAGPAELNAALAVLSDEERARHARFRFERDRNEFALAHSLLRNTLSELGPLGPAAWRFGADIHGKPILGNDMPEPRWAFNLSHTRDMVACIISLGVDVGIDVERFARATDWRTIAQRYFAREEFEALERLPEPERAARFIEIWTLKEACAKALGLGLSHPLRATRFDLDRRDRISFIMPGDVADAWQFAMYAPTADHLIAVAVRDEARGPRPIDVRSARDTPAIEPLRTSRTSRR